MNEFIRFQEIEHNISDHQRNINGLLSLQPDIDLVKSAIDNAFVYYEQMYAQAPSDDFRIRLIDLMAKNYFTFQIYYQKEKHDEAWEYVQDGLHYINLVPIENWYQIGLNL